MHSCPECGQACYCSGDIEDHDTGEEYTGICTCCAGRNNIPDSPEDDQDCDAGNIMEDEDADRSSRFPHVSEPETKP